MDEIVKVASQSGCLRWVRPMGLAVVGVLALMIGGIDKVTVFVGPFLMAASMLSILRKTNHLRVDVEVPMLVILSGVLLFICRRPETPVPDWLIRDQKQP